MSHPEEKLAELGLKLPEVAKPVAAYVPVVRTGNLVYTSGQLPLRDGTLIATGKSGDTVTPRSRERTARDSARTVTTHFRPRCPLCEFIGRRPLKTRWPACRPIS